MERLVISANEATTMLNVSHDTMQHWLITGEIPAYRDGRGWKIPVQALNEYVMNRAVAEAAERKKKHEGK